MPVDLPYLILAALGCAWLSFFVVPSVFKPTHKKARQLSYLIILALILTLFIFRSQANTILLVLGLIVAMSLAYLLLRKRFQKRNSKVKDLETRLRQLEEENNLIHEHHG